MKSLRGKHHFSFATVPAGSFATVPVGAAADENTTFQTWTSLADITYDAEEKRSLVNGKNRDKLFATEPTFYSSGLPPLSGDWCRGPEGSIVSGDAAYHIIPGSETDQLIRAPSMHSVGTIEQEKTWRQIGIEFTTAIPFQVTMALLILLNALVIGLETDIPDFQWWGPIEMTFLVIFSLELSFRIAVYGCGTYFDVYGADFIWNFFDFLVVTCGFVDIVLSFMVNNGNGGPESMFRIIRLLRILRIFRIIRFLQQLYLLAFGFALAAMAIFWVAVLMAFLLYVCAVVLVRTIGHGGHGHEFLHTHFANIPTSMLTLFELMSSPDLTPYHDVMSEYPLMTAFLIAFVMFGSFGMLALLTGVISEAMFDKNQLRIEQKQRDRERTRLFIVDECSQLFDTIDENGDGNVSKSELKTKLQQIVEFFEREGMDCYEEDLDVLMTILDTDQSGTVNKDEFCHGILLMAEGVRPLMIMESSFNVLHIKTKVEEIAEMSSTMQRQFEDAAAERRLLTETLGGLDLLVQKLLSNHANGSRLLAKGLDELNIKVQRLSAGQSSSGGVNQFEINRNGPAEVSAKSPKFDTDFSLAFEPLRSEVRAMMEYLQTLPALQPQSAVGFAASPDLLSAPESVLAASSVKFDPLRQDVRVEVARPTWSVSPAAVPEVSAELKSGFLRNQDVKASLISSKAAKPLQPSASRAKVENDVEQEWQAMFVKRPPSRNVEG